MTIEEIKRTIKNIRWMFRCGHSSYFEMQEDIWSFINKSCLYSCLSLNEKITLLRENEIFIYQGEPIVGWYYENHADQADTTGRALITCDGYRYHKHYEQEKLRLTFLPEVMHWKSCDR